MKFSIISLALLLAIISTAHGVKVNVGIYYECLCPACKEQFLKNLVPARKAIGQYMNIDLVPYGNAFYSHHDDKVFCQHGETECYGNTVHACALDMFDFDTAFEYIKCMFESGYTDPRSVASKCAQSMNLDYHKIQNCAQGSKGAELIKKMAAKTNRLNPRIEYVPWDMINDQHVDYRVNFIKYICQNYLKNENVPACRLF